MAACVALWAIKVGKSNHSLTHTKFAQPGNHYGVRKLPRSHRQESNAFSLQYTLNSETYTVNYTIENETYTFEFIDPAGNRTVETYTP